MVIAEERASETAGSILGVKHIAQPQELPDGQIDPLPTMRPPLEDCGLAKQQLEQCPDFQTRRAKPATRDRSLGSFNTHSEAENQIHLRSVASARLRRLLAMRLESQSASKGFQSSHSQPAEASICSSSLITTLDSQTVDSVDLGKLHPNKLKVRVNTEVPLRCIPATKIADRAAAPSRSTRSISAFVAVRDIPFRVLFRDQRRATAPRMAPTLGSSGRRRLSLSQSLDDERKSPSCARRSIWSLNLSRRTSST